MFLLLVAVVLDALMVQHDLSAEQSEAAMSGWLPMTAARPAAFAPTQLSSASTGTLPVPGTRSAGSPVLLPKLQELQTPRAQAPAMIAARDVFQDASSTTPKEKLQANSGGAGKLLAAAAGAAGFVLTPSRRPLVRAAGGALLAGLAKTAGGKVLGSGGSDARSRPAVAALLADAEAGVKTVEPEAVEAIRKKLRVPEAEFRKTLEEMYMSFLEAALESGTVDTTELAELLRLQEVFSLTPTAVGNAVYETARRLLSRYRAYWESDEPSDTKVIRDKFIFLAERVLSQDESEEGYRYETLRLEKLLGVSEAEWQNTAAEVASPFYTKALDNVLEGKPATADQLAQIRDALGLPEERAAALHAEALAKQLEELGATSPRIAELEELLECSPDQVRAAVMSHSGPLYTETLEAAATRVGDAALRGELDARQKELRIEAADATKLEVQAFEAHAASIRAEASAALRTGSTKEALGKAQELVTFTREASALTGQVLEPELGAKTEVMLLYRAKVQQVLADGKVGDSEQAALQELRSALQLSVEDAASVYEQAASPFAKDAMSKAKSGGSASEISRKLDDLGLSAASRTKLAAEVYTEHVTSMAGSALTEEQTADLAKMRTALGLAITDVQAVQDEVVAPEYEKAAKEAFSDGTITEARLDGLVTLGERLGISEAAAEKIYAEEVRGALKGLTKTAADIVEKENTEEGKKMGIAAGSVATEVLKVLEFAEAAQVFGPGPDGKEVAGTYLRPEMDFDADVLKMIYRQSLVEGFSESKTELLDKAGRLALLLGLDEFKANEINLDVGGMIIRQYLASVLPKGPIGESEREFVKSVQDTLHLQPEEVEEIVDGSQRGQVLKILDALDTQEDFGADDVRSLRDEAERFNVDLANDLELPRAQLERLFLYELEDFIDTGGDGGEELEEATKQLGVSEARAQEMLEEQVQKRIDDAVLTAWIANKAGKTAEAAEKMESVAQLAALAPLKAKVSIVNKSAMQDLYLLWAGGGRDAEQSALLAEVLGTA